MSYTYNSDGSADTVTKFSGITKKYSYQNNNVDSIQTSDGTNSLTESREYDDPTNTNNETAMTLKDQLGNIQSKKSFHYNADGNVTRDTQGTNDQFVNDYIYNSNNDNQVVQQSQAYTDTSGQNVPWKVSQSLSGYDTNGNVTSLSATGNNQLMSYGFGYDAMNRESSIQFNNTSKQALFSKSLNYSSSNNQLDSIR